MKKLLLLAALTTSLTVVAQDDDQSGVYLGIGSVGTAVELDYFDDDFAVRNINFKVGYQFNNSLAVEIRVHGESDTDELSDWYIEATKEGQTDLLVRWTPNVDWAVKPYLLVGVSQIDMKAESTYYYSNYSYYGGYSYSSYTVEESDSETAGTFGAGLLWDINQHFGLTADFLFPQYSDATVAQFSLGAQYKF